MAGCCDLKSAQAVQSKQESYLDKISAKKKKKKKNEKRNGGKVYILMSKQREEKISIIWVIGKP